MSATSFLRKKLVDELTGGAAYAPGPLFISLHRADPGPSGSRAEEVDGGGYSRQPLAGVMGEADPITGISTNILVINFGPASSDWGTVAFIGIDDALTGGHMLATGAPVQPKTITSGQPFQIVPGNLRLRMT